MAVFDGVIDQQFSGEPLFEYLARPAGFVQRGLWPVIDFVPAAENRPDEGFVGKILVNVIYAVAKILSDPGHVTADGDGAD